MMRCAWLLASVLLSLAVARHPMAFTDPERTILSSGALAQIVGGAGAASVSVIFPQNFATGANGLGAVTWNIPGNRCQYTCSSFGPTDVGFDISMSSLVLGNLAAPALKIISDGNLVATGGATFQATEGDYKYYTGRVRTQCVGGSNAGNFCTRDSDCAGGNCRTCDLSVSPATCNVPPSTAGPCTLATSEEACYLLTNCATGSGGGCTGDAIQDCSTNGAGTGPGGSSTGPFHSAIGQVAQVVNGSTIVIGQSEDIYQMVKVSNTDQTKCQGLPE